MDTDLLQYLLKSSVAVQRQLGIKLDTSSNQSDGVFIN